MHVYIYIFTKWQCLPKDRAEHKQKSPARVRLFNAVCRNPLTSLRASNWENNGNPNGNIGNIMIGCMNHRLSQT